jgi:hypothetical protein
MRRTCRSRRRTNALIPSGFEVLESRAMLATVSVENRVLDVLSFDPVN